MVEDGYEFFAKRRLVTLFSAPNYCGEFNNAGAMMSVDEGLMCSFQASGKQERALHRNTPSGARRRTTKQAVLSVGEEAKRLRRRAILCVGGAKTREASFDAASHTFEAC